MARLLFFVKKEIERTCEFKSPGRTFFHVVGKVGEKESVIETFESEKKANNFAKKFNSPEFRASLRKDLDKADKLLGAWWRQKKVEDKALALLKKEKEKLPSDRSLIFVEHKFLGVRYRKEKPLPRVSKKEGEQDVFVMDVKGTPFSIRRVSRKKTERVRCREHGHHEKDAGEDVFYYVCYKKLNCKISHDYALDSANKAEKVAKNLCDQKTLTKFAALARKIKTLEARLSKQWGKSSSIYDKVNKLEKAVPHGTINFFREHKHRL